MLFNELKGQEFIFWMVAALGVRTAEERYYQRETRQTVCERLNDVLGEKPFGFRPFILKYNGISQINGSYGYRSAFAKTGSCQGKLRPISKTVAPPK